MPRSIPLRARRRAALVAQGLPPGSAAWRAGFRVPPTTAAAGPPATARAEGAEPPRPPPSPMLSNAEWLAKYAPPAAREAGGAGVAP